jgi:hypothetical protein
MTGTSAHIRVPSENGNAIYLCSCTDVAHGKRRIVKSGMEPIPASATN